MNAHVKNQVELKLKMDCLIRQARQINLPAIYFSATKSFQQHLLFTKLFFFIKKLIMAVFTCFFTKARCTSKFWTVIPGSWVRESFLNVVSLRSELLLENFCDNIHGHGHCFVFTRLLFHSSSPTRTSNLAVDKKIHSYIAYSDAEANPPS